MLPLSSPYRNIARIQNPEDLDMKFHRRENLKFRISIKLDIYKYRNLNLTRIILWHLFAKSNIEEESKPQFCKRIANKS